MSEEIHVLNEKVRLLQPDGGFRTSLDSVMLAAAVRLKSGDTVLDMGCGVGGAAFCLGWRVPGISLTGVDCNADYIALAQANAELNERRFGFEVSDIRSFRLDEKPSFDHVMLNPPFFQAGAHTPSPDPGRAAANGHQEEGTGLDDWLRAAHRLVRSKGGITVIYPASGLDRLIQGLGRRFGAIEIIPLWPRRNAEAKRVIVRAIKDRRTPAILHPGLVLHKEDGSYTIETEKVLRDGNEI